MAAQPMPDDDPKHKRTRTERWYDRRRKNLPVGYLVEERRTLRRSWVRIVVTLAAAAFVFGGGFYLVLLLLDPGNAKTVHLTDGTLRPYARTAIDLFMYLVPTASMVITYWFATRGTGDSQNRQD